jgi:hypothetical protein
MYTDNTTVQALEVLGLRSFAFYLFSILMEVFAESLYLIRGNRSFREISLGKHCTRQRLSISRSL